MNTTRPALRFGIWAQTQGAWGSRHHPEDPPDASWERNRRQVLEAEELGYDSTLLAQHTIHPHGDDQGVLEAWTASAALAALTQRIEIITAIKPYLYHPVVLAKMALEIEAISKGRFAINFVNAWFKPELARAGIGFAEHDARYAYGAEWIAIVRDLIAGRRVDFAGKFFQIDGYKLFPADEHRDRPLIYGGGESEAARDVLSKTVDTFFINGQPIEDVRAMIADVGNRPRAGTPIGFALSAFVIARETAAAAEAALSDAFALAAKDAPTVAGLRANADPAAVMFKTAASTPRIGTNGGTAAGLVGSYDDIAARIAAFHDAGIGLFMLQFQPFEPEMRRFAEHVIPRVRALRARS
jgi:alkanesulfonate monooxygenase